MKIKTVKNEVKIPTLFGGLLSGGITLEIKGGNANSLWTGPKITPAVWYPILAWFAKVNKETHSECQVRLYCNGTTGTWAAWAYPQQANTGMAAREIENEDSAAQRQLFKASEGWLYLGTVHHHCGSMAFQSSTDKENESNQDGLHITIGKLYADHYDMHARFYVAGCEFEPDMSAFWDIGEQMKALAPVSVYDMLARHQMTMPAPADTVIPAQWEANLIAPPRTTFPLPVSSHTPANGNGASYAGGLHTEYGNHYKNRGVSLRERKELAVAEVVKAVIRSGGLLSEFIDWIDEFRNDEQYKILKDAAIDNQVDLIDIFGEIDWCINQTFQNTPLNAALNAELTGELDAETREANAELAADQQAAASEGAQKPTAEQIRQMSDDERQEKAIQDFYDRIYN